MTPSALRDVIPQEVLDLLPAALSRWLGDLDPLTAAVTGAAALVVLVLALVLMLMPDDERKMKRRVQRMTSRGSARRPETSQSVGSLRRSTDDSSIASLDRLIKRVLPNVGVMRARLARSGWPIKIGEYLLICLVLGALTAVGLSLAIGLPMAVDALVGVVVGVGLPHFVVRMRIAKRIRKFTMLLPDALDLIVRGIRSGLPASEALRTIADEIEDPVGTEFREVTDQMKIGVGLDEAMWTAAKKLDLPEFNFLVISLSIQQETGGNLAEILEKLADMVRRREQMRLKVRAMSSEARASAMIIGSLPFIMGGVISFVNPTYISSLFTDPRGWVMSGVGLTSMLIGMLVMSKMVKFEI